MAKYKVIWVDKNDDVHYSIVSAPRRAVAVGEIKKKRKTFKKIKQVYEDR